MIQAEINAEEKGILPLVTKVAQERESLEQNLIRWSALIDTNAEYHERLESGQVK